MVEGAEEGVKAASPMMVRLEVEEVGAEQGGGEAVAEVTLKRTPIQETRLEQTARIPGVRLKLLEMQL